MPCEEGKGWGMERKKVHLAEQPTEQAAGLLGKERDSLLETIACNMADSGPANGGR